MSISNVTRVAVLIACFFLFCVPGFIVAQEETIEITAAGFEYRGGPLPAPLPQIQKSPHRSPWPQVIGHNQPQGFSLYQEEIKYLDLLFQDMNNDNLNDLVYISKKTDKIIELNIYLQKPGEIFSDKSIQFRFTFDKTFDTVAPYILDLNNDRVPDLALIKKSPPQPPLMTQQIEITVVLGTAPLKYELDRLFSIFSDNPPVPIYFLKNKKSNQTAILLAENSLKTPSKKVLSKLFFQKKVEYGFKVVEHQKNKFKLLEGSKTEIELNNLENSSLTLEKIFPNWIPVKAPLIFHWEKRIKDKPAIFYDWNRDGSEDRIVIDKANSKHQIFDGNTNREIDAFHLPRNTLLTGAYLDLNADGSFEEIDIIYEHEFKSLEVPLSTTLNVYHHFTKTKKESYSIPGMVIFPQSFADIDEDGDIDLLAIDKKNLQKSWASKLITKWRNKIPATLLVYKRENGFYPKNPSLHQKIWISPTDNNTSSLKIFLKKIRR